MVTQQRADELVQRFVDWIVRERPVDATRLGDHSRDGDLPDLAPEAVDAATRELANLHGEVQAALAGAAASPAQGDLVLLDDALRSRRFRLEQRDELGTDPLVGLDLATQAVHELLRRAHNDHGQGVDATPWLACATARARAVPRLLEQAAARLEGSPAPHREVALQRAEAAAELYRDELPRTAQLVGADATAASEAGADAADGVAGYAAFLEELGDREPLPWRLGAQDHAVALRATLGSRMPAAELVTRAERALREVHRELEEVATRHWGTVVGPHQPLPDDPGERVAGALAAVSRDAPSREGLVDEARRAVEDAIAVCRATGTVDLPDTAHLSLEEVPPSQRGLYVAYLQPAPPLEPDAGSTYYLSPVPRSWSAERAASFLREYNRWALRSLAVHEGYPGHFVQLDHAGRHPRLARRLLGSSAFAEGWAVYAEQLVREVSEDGPFADPRYHLVQLKMGLRIVANALLDIGLHVGDLDDDRAVELLVGSALQEPAEAHGKLVRAKVTPAQLCSYFAGGEEVRDLRADAERRLGPAFDLAGFHRAVLRHGTPPAAVLRRELAAEPTPP